MPDSSERLHRFAAITPLNDRRVMTALLDRTPPSRRGVLRDFVIQVGTVGEMGRVQRHECMEVGLEESYRLAILARYDGNRIGVKIWEGLTEAEVFLIDYFDFTPTVAFPREVDAYITPPSLHRTIAHIQETQHGIARTFSSYQVSKHGIAAPLMGLSRMIQAAKDTRAEYLSQYQ